MNLTKPSRPIEFVHLVERLFLTAQSPAVKMLAGVGIELLTGRSLVERPLISRAKGFGDLMVSVTILSTSMEHVFLRRIDSKQQAQRIPRISAENDEQRLPAAALDLAKRVTGDESCELLLGARPLSLELWDDEPEALGLGLNFLVASRAAPRHTPDQEFQFVEFSELHKLNLDARELLALSEMLGIMGMPSIYDKDEEDSISSAA